MPRLLDKALAVVSELPEQEQEALAAWILEELASERWWMNGFSSSERALDRLAEEALAEHRAGLTEPLDTDG